MLSEKRWSPQVDHSMFENSNAARQPGSPNSKSVTSLNQRPASTADTARPSGSQHLKNALNLGKAVGAKVNDLLRRKDPSSLGDIGVTEVNRNVGAVWPSMDNSILGIAPSSRVSQDSFPRLEPPPPNIKKRLPRALKTTRDMMISPDPVVAAPDVSNSCTSPPEETAVSKEQPEGGKMEPARDPAPSEALDFGIRADETRAPRSIGTELDGLVEDGTDDQSHLLLSVPDLIHKDNLETLQKAEDPETRMASTPCPGKAGLRISLADGDPENAPRSASVEHEEPHPDLLSFE